jgi:hypothetical protein
MFCQTAGKNAWRQVLALQKRIVAGLEGQVQAPDESVINSSKDLIRRF